ncbi:MYB DNA-binding domain protein [Aspergillus brunneoviolaceus CBS 621.78]|uniref:Uncharacterized protein n=1 Tax=Aspergillus brunneoviolaceus CBS 621.78 TaxID=1450534 RepID=A0ACD1FYM9_9EURO|nr:hypothetical protein BO95DRAFT_446338 [Aspergillus brunneoviolaceus CBS 621.78]RAH42048.1 hypothetical protein BO95DRAFT_446338 [Aspergillus brunneoviolaceus CBS 621.78]
MASAKRKRNSTALNATTPNAGGRAGFVPQTPRTPLTNSSTHPAKRKKVGGGESSKKKNKKQQQQQQQEREESQELPYISSPVSTKRTSTTIATNGHHHNHHDAAPVSGTPEPEIPIDPALRGEPVAIQKPQDHDHEMQDADQTEASTPGTGTQGDVTGASSEPNAPSVRPKKGRRPQEKENESNSSQTTSGKTGFFSPDEIQKLEAFKLDFCTSNGVEADTFDMMVQHSVRDGQEQWPVHTDIITKTEFWQKIYETIPDRDKRSVYRFMRRHFQCSSQKPHHWTHEQDEELITLHRLHGAKWAYIAKMIGRSDDDVVQRWKNRLQHRRTMNRGPWSEQEVQAMMDVLQEVWHTMKATGVEVGQDVYELDEVYIAWGVVSDKMNNCRSRQQCADKWRKLRAKVLNQRSKENPDAFHDSAVVKKSDGSRRSKSRAVSTPQQKPNTKFKSQEFVESEVEESEEEENEEQEEEAEDGEEDEEEEEQEEEEDESAEPEVPIKYERHSMELDDAHVSPPLKQPTGAIRHITNTDSREDSAATESDDDLVDRAIKPERRQQSSPESEGEEEEEEEDESPSPDSKRDVKPNLRDEEVESENGSDSDGDESEEEDYSTPPSGQKSANLKVTSPRTVTKSSQQRHQGSTIKPRSPVAVAIKSRKSPSPTASASSSEDEEEDDDDDEEEEEESGRSDSETSSTGGDWPAKPATTSPNARKPSTKTNSSPNTTAKRTTTTKPPKPEPESESEPASSSSSEEDSPAPKQGLSRPSIPTRPSFGSSSQPTRPPSQRLSIKELRDASLSKANSKLKAPKPSTLSGIMSDAKSRAKSDSSDDDDDESSSSDSDADADSE